MRSRYSAYFFRLVDYLVSSQHPDTRSKNLASELTEFIHEPMWRSLTILGTSKGQKGDKSGKVEFTAQYHEDGELYEVHEVSRFRRYKSRWKYLDDKG